MTWKDFCLVALLIIVVLYGIVADMPEEKPKKDEDNG